MPETSPTSAWPERLGSAALLGILVVMPILFWTSASEFFEWPKLVATRLCAIAIVLAAMWEVSRRGRPSPYPLPFAARTGEGNNGGRVPTSSLQDEPGKKPAPESGRGESTSRDRSVPAPTGNPASIASPETTIRQPPPNPKSAIQNPQSGDRSVPAPTGHPASAALSGTPPGNPESVVSVNPKPETRNPKPASVNPKPETRNSKPPSVDPKPETRNPKLAPLDLPVLLYLAIYALSTAFSIQPGHSLGLRSHDYGGLASVLAAASGYLAVRLWARDPETVRGLLRWACDAGMIIALYALAQREGIDPFRWALPSQERVYSTFGSPNYYAAYLCLLLPVSLALAETSPRPAIRLFGLVRTLLLLAMLGATFSRAGWAGGIAGGLTYVVLRWRSRREGGEPGGRGAAVALAVIVIATLAGSVRWSEAWARLESAARWKGSTLESRWLAWTAVPEIAGEAPWFGTGPETFLSTFAKRRPEALNVSVEWSTRPAQAHNEFLHLLSTTGTLGLGAFLGLLAVWLWRVSWPGGRGPGSTSTLPRYPAILRAGVNAGIVAFLVQSAAGFSTAGTAPIFWAFLAMAQALLTAPCPPPPGERGAGMAPGEGGIAVALRGLIRGATIAFAVLAVADLWTGVRADLAFARGSESARAADEAATIGRKDLEAAEAGDAMRPLQEAVSLDPMNDAAWRTMAETHARLPDHRREAREASDRAREANPFEAENPRIAAHVRFIEALALPTDEAVLAERLRLLRETEDLYRAAWEMEPSRVIIPFQFAVVCAEAGDLRGAEALCREVQRLKPDYPDGYVLQADICLRQGRVEEARRLVDRALEIDPEHPQAGALRGQMGRGN